MIFPVGAMIACQAAVSASMLAKRRREEEEKKKKENSSKPLDKQNRK